MPEGQLLCRASMLRHLKVLASDEMRGRESGRAGIRRARRYLIQSLTDAGVEPLMPGFVQPFVFEGLDGRRTQGENIVGLIRGSVHPETYFTLSAHYDHIGTDGQGDSGEVCNGADDNASGVAAVLAIAKWLVQNPPQSSFVVCLFDGEEAGLKWSAAFVSRAPLPLDRLALEINVDMIARSDEGILWAAGAHHHPGIARHLDAIAAQASAPLLLGHDRWSFKRGENWTHMSDHGSFHDAGLPWVHFGVSNHADTHSTDDEIESIDEPFFLHCARTVHTAICHFDAVADELISLRHDRC